MRRHLVAMGLPALALVLALAAAPAPCAGAAGDRWIWPGPPDGDDNSPAFYDPGRDRLTFVNQRGAPFTVWMLAPGAPRTWSVAPFGWTSGSGTIDPLAIYDPTGDRLLTVDEDFVPDDTCCTGTDYAVPHAIDLAAPAWPPATLHGALDRFHFGCMLAYDARRQRMLLVGGYKGPSGRALCDSVRFLDLGVDTSGWAGFAVPGATLPVTNGLAMYDSTDDRVFVYGGRDTTGHWRASLFTLDLSAPAGWEQWALVDSGLFAPYNDSRTHVVVDSPRHRLLLTSEVSNGYFLRGGNPFMQEPRDSILIWQFDLATRVGWTRVAYAGRSPNVIYAQPAFDPGRNRLSMYGAGQRCDLDELVVAADSAWVSVQRSDRVPNLFSSAPVLADAPRHRVIALSLGADAWTMQQGTTDTWEECLDDGSSPPPRSFPCAVYDTLRQRGFLFGGGDGGSELGDLWQFTIDDTNRVTWQRLFPAGEVPAPRYGASAILDPIRRRMVMFGGYAGRAMADTWALSLDDPVRWTRLPDRGFPPSARSWASAVYDSRRDAMTVYGGNLGTPDTWQLTDDTWTLSFADGDVWVPVTALGRPPTPRCAQGAVYDSRRDRMIIFWGAAYNGARIDCAELDLADGPRWRDLGATGLNLIGRGFFNAIYDANRDQALLLGGERPSGNYGPAVFPDDLYADFSANPQTSPAPLSGPPLALLGFAPNPTRDIENVAFDLPRDADVRARIYDASGRLVRDLGPKRYVAGRHLLVWDGKNAAGAVPASGVYFARLSMLGQEFSGKFVLLH